MIDLYWASALQKWVTIPDDSADEDIARCVSQEIAQAENAFFDGAIRTGVRRARTVRNRYYGDWIIRHNPPPIPPRDCDWQYHHKDYDGPGDGRCGYAASLADAMREIDEMERAA